MLYKFESEVSKALIKLLETEFNYDVIIYIGEKPNFKEFHAHSNFLHCRSDYFNKILSAKDVEKKDGKYIIKKPNITPQAFDVIIKYLYTGYFDITNKTGIEILNIMIASEDLKLNQLIKVAEEFFIENHQQFIQIDPVEILQIIYCRQVFSNIQKPCLEMICFEPEILFNSVKFIDLSAPLLEIILKRDDLRLKEIEVWDNLIKWGLSQEKTLNKNVSKWRQEEFNVFKRILYKFIPLIRFCGISSVDYFNKVRPYEEILSRELREEILKFHMIPGYKLTLINPLQRRYIIDSILINQKHAEIFTNWIKRDEISTVNIYNFRLLYRASRDGNTTAAFHQNCDNRGANIVIIKISDSEQIVGGYNPLCWDSSSKYKLTNDSFIFSFTDKNKFQTAKIGYCNRNDPCSVFCGKYYGPLFGYNIHSRGHDLWFNNNVWSSSNPGSYPKINGMPTGKFKVDDYEVFQVIKKESVQSLKWYWW